MNDALDSACTAGMASITVLPEPIFFPILPALIQHPGVRLLMAAGRLSVRTCPIVHVGEVQMPPLRSLSVCDVAEDNLKLNHVELDNVARGLGCPHTVRNTLSAKHAAESLFESDALHVAAHGTPISILRDAFFSVASESQPLSGLYRFQWQAAQSRCRMVFLNSCFSADTLNHNVMEGFRTNEQIGLPSMFLLNRRSAVVGTSWATFDTVAYLFAQLFYTALREHGDVGVAFARASARLHDMETTDVRTSLETINSPELAQEKQALFQGSGQPFIHAYVTGNYQCLTLLPGPQEKDVTT